MNIKHFIDEKTLLVEVTEEIDHHSSQIIKDRIDYEIQRFMPKKLILDLDKVGFMDSAGIGLIIGRYKIARSYGGEMEIQNVSEKLKRIFSMSGIEKIVTIKERLVS